mgnify:CR=1 FL=1
MNTKSILRDGLIFGIVFSAALFILPPRSMGEAKGEAKGKEKGGFDAEKQKAMANPYANDFGPDKLDVSGYPKEHQEGYSLAVIKCAKCHSGSRLLNSQFVEPMGKDSVERGKKIDEWKKADPAMFKEKNVWQPEGDIWQRYVKRMMAKPGCEISKEEGKKIWNFLVYDSNQRKIGAKKVDWEKHRKKLLEDFKAKHPARYKELYETSSAK